MEQSQSGILLEHCRFAIFLEASFQGDIEQIRSGCKQFYADLVELQQQFATDRLGAVVAFGDQLWQEFSNGHNETVELKPFRPLGNGLAPATQHDLLIHIQSLRHDVNFTLAQKALAAFGDAVKIEEETHGFRWLDERDLSGFIDGTANPVGEERGKVALIGQGEEVGGSYVFIQRYEHNLKRWQKFSLDEQQKIIGRTKEDSIELPESERPDTSHVSRVELEENGEELSILRQSLPYGAVSGVHGLYFIAYSARLHNIEQQLLSMFGELDGKNDQLLRFTKPVTGGYYFAPSLTRLLALSSSYSN